ncbi:EGF-like repeat and discoidin I-like domain-containing protein 3 isoform X2 [Leucoraja erinacea]|uniref:EGF-like repeat and discoidin I-like domain-containing protein 3 isoform X2 n=1 Tax=Leucoraja erinaceus TaxID=7782 RepID=UPI002455914C|nr:EGF-like repeat and discoidin I-like domain-containing protein 3 isoform X2 [Leucoraja erinacea]
MRTLHFSSTFILSFSLAIILRLAKGEICKTNPCENGGTCMAGLADEAFSCECPDGFTGPSCSSILEVGACQPNPCHNGGICEVSDSYRGDTFVGYICRCPDGFSGIHCQHNINECEFDPCRNGGICTDLIANYSCECPGEFMGRNCQHSK